MVVKQVVKRIAEIWQIEGLNKIKNRQTPGRRFDASRLRRVIFERDE